MPFIPRALELFRRKPSTTRTLTSSSPTFPDSLKTTTQTTITSNSSSSSTLRGSSQASDSRIEKKQEIAVTVREIGVRELAPVRVSSKEEEGSWFDAGRASYCGNV